MGAERLLDAAALLGLIPALAVTAPLALTRNGRRPLAALILIMLVLWLWAGIEGLDSDQTTAQHVRRIIAAVALFVCPLWASIDGRNAEKRLTHT